MDSQFSDTKHRVENQSTFQDYVDIGRSLTLANHWQPTAFWNMTFDELEAWYLFHIKFHERAKEQ